MYKKILVPIDGSDTANTGLREAIKLAQALRAQIRIVHVIDDLVMVSPQLYGITMDNLTDELKQRGATLVESARKLVQDAGIPVDTQLIEGLGGGAGERVLHAAREWAADLIACGTHGRRGLRRIVMGSDAEFIVRRSPVPILLVRASGSNT